MNRFLFLSIIPLVVLIPISICDADASSGASFATQSVFLSQSSPEAGTSVLVYANIANPSGTSFEGQVVFYDGTAEIGSVAVSLAAGEAQVVSVSWQPTALTHVIVAKLEDGQGNVVAQESATFQIAAPPPGEAPGSAASASSDAVGSSLPIENAIGSFSPSIASTSEPLFVGIDNARQSAANTLQVQIAQTEPKLPAQIPGIASSKNTAPQGVSGWLFAILWTLYFYLLTILRYVIVSAAFFYAAAIILFMFLLYWLYRKIAGPKYRY